MYGHCQGTACRCVLCMQRPSPTFTAHQKPCPLALRDTYRSDATWCWKPELPSPAPRTPRLPARSALASGGAKLPQLSSAPRLQPPPSPPTAPARSRALTWSLRRPQRPLPVPAPRTGTERAYKGAPALPPAALTQPLGYNPKLPTFVLA
ncbi:hypothetical protein NDU88_002955 [Pleurodeles waltl]|uniref:Uncharacterized protein n=1 Tax=Pleurodeles waltl TaxID=8319 RepID=A0AAV7WR06_PLEWA|nr:hypothetical protein NDU88_002955 [Pleurodeles waltl]